MAEELQGLLDRIRKDGLDKAEQEAQSIVEKAQSKAASIIKDAEQSAKKKLETAEAEAENFTQRSISAIEQAARDVVLSVGDAIQNAFEALARNELQKALKGEDFAKIVYEVVNAYAQKGDKAGDMDVLLAADQQEQVKAYLNKAFTDAMRKGITIKSQRGIIAGFSVVLKDQGVEHDFRDETLTAAFTQLLRPQLAEIVKKATEINSKAE